MVFFFFPSCPTALPFPALHPAVKQEPWMQPAVSLLHLLTAAPALRKGCPGHDKLCAGSVICVSSNFPLIHFIYTRWKTQPQGCYKPCCCSHKGPSCQLGSRWSMPSAGAGGRSEIEFMHLSEMLRRGSGPSVQPLQPRRHPGGTASSARVLAPQLAWDRAGWIVGRSERRVLATTPALGER